jgi:peptide deformylase
MVKPIVMWPDPVLRQVSEPVKDPYSAEIKGLIQDMVETMRAARGVGLSAVQIGVPLRIFVLEAESKHVWAFINPTVLPQGAPIPMHEGCLSLPGIFEWVPRAPEALMTADAFMEDVGGEIKPGTVLPLSGLMVGADALRFSGLTAHAAQHEHDHLEGKMFADDLPALKQKILKLQLKRPW